MACCHGGRGLWEICGRMYYRSTAANRAGSRTWRRPLDGVAVTGSGEHDVDDSASAGCEFAIVDDSGGPLMDRSEQAGREHFAVASDVYGRADLSGVGGVLQAGDQRACGVVVQDAATVAPSGEQRGEYRRVGAK